MDDIDRLRISVLKELGDDDRWFDPTGYDSVALAIIDSIYSTGKHYTGVINAVNGYRDRRRKEGADPNTDSTGDLLSAADRWGGTEGLAEATNRWRCWSSQDAPLKAEAALQAAGVLGTNAIESIDDVRTAFASPAQQVDSQVKREWTRIPGHRSGLTWAYFLMLCGVPGVKADRMVVGYVSRVVGRQVTPAEAASLVSALADQRGLRRTKLDHAIWRHESGRSVYVDEDQPE